MQLTTRELCEKAVPGGGLMGVLEGRAEAVAGTFNAQAVSNTLWAYARMGREPGVGLRCSLETSLEGRILQVVSDFTSQTVIDTRWTYSQLELFSCFCRPRSRRVWQNATMPTRRRCRTLLPEAERGDPPEVHCDAQSVAESVG